MKQYVVLKIEWMLLYKKKNFNIIIPIIKTIIEFTFSNIVFYKNKWILIKIEIKIKNLS